MAQPVVAECKLLARRERTPMAQVQSEIRLFDHRSPRTRPTGCEPLVAAADEVLSQCESLVQGATDAAYAADSQTMRGGTLGKHIRHTLDHFAAALEVVTDPARVICYDQ